MTVVGRHLSYPNNNPFGTKRYLYLIAFYWNLLGIYRFFGLLSRYKTRKLLAYFTIQNKLFMWVYISETWMIWEMFAQSMDDSTRLQLR